MGRHREFCTEKALDRAIQVFWQKGYEGASYSDLTKATGVERPALYAAFGNKEALFRKALQRYDESYLAFIPEALQLPTSRQVVEHILLGAVALNTQYSEHTGCLGVNGMIAGSDDAEPVRLALVQFRAAGEQQIRERFSRAKNEGDLSGEAQPAALAAFVMAVLHGIAVQAKAGSDRETLETVARQAMAGWPDGR